MNNDEFLKYLQQKKIENIKEINYQVLNISQSTIRRKIKKLEELGFLQFLHGGDIKLIDDKNISILDDYKLNISKRQKIKIAKEAALKVEDNDLIFLDNGTTVRYMLSFLNNRDVIIYTNGYKHIDYIKENNLNIDIRIIPGKVKIKESSIIGEEAILYLESLNIDKTFIGANGFDSKYGITTPNEDEKNLKKFAIEIALESFLLIDQTKYGLVSKFKICNTNEIGIITN